MLASAPQGPPAPRVRLAVAVVVLCGALPTLALGTLHLIGILRRAFASGLANFTYTFRFYSLVLVGLLVVLPALVSTTTVRGLTRGDGAARARALRANAVLALVNLPLVPIQRIAIPLSGLALLSLAALVWAWPHFREGGR
jgi:hypothetical protein